MAGNQGFTQTLNLLEVTDGAEALQNLGGGTIDADLRLFAGSSTRKSNLFWDRFFQTSSTINSPSDITPGTRLEFGKNSTSTYTDKDIVKISPINLIKDIAFRYIGFDSDGTLISNIGLDITYIRGENYIEGVYNNIELSGGNGFDATANITVNSNGEVSSVEITNNGDGYIQGDILSCNLTQGTGFIIRIVGFPWRCLMVLNSAYDAKLETTSKLSVEVKNTNPSLNGTYSIRRDSTSNQNAFYEPNNSNLPSYDVNRLQFAHNKISENLTIFDIDGDGVYTSYDADLIEIYLNNEGSTSSQYEALFSTYVGNNAPTANAQRKTGGSINNYFTGIDRNFFNIDDTGLFDYTIINSLFQNYATNGFLYQRKVASVVIQQEPNNSITFNNTNIIDFRIKSNPNYSLPSNLNSSYVKPYIKIFKEIAGQNINLLDNFSLFGTKQSCETNANDYKNNVIIGASNSTFNYTIFNKQVVNGKYIVDIVISGIGKDLNIPFGNSPQLTPINAIPVFDSDDEYAIFDSNAIDKFFLKTNPRTIVENLKNLVLFSQNSNFESPIGTSAYEGRLVEITTLLSDLVIERDDTLETENILNLNPPEIVDDGTQEFGQGNNLGNILASFSYGIEEGYAAELQNITDTVDESLYLRSTKYRSDRNLYYKREININGFISAYDPDAFNLSITELKEDISPGIYISDSTSQITNTLASDYARKTRSFSSDYNPWNESEGEGGLKTLSLSVTINDLFWTSEISLYIGKDTATTSELAAMGYETGITGETLDTNFNATTVAAGQSYKLPTIINGEVFYIIMKKS